jgi:hypothetical protein
MYTKYKRGECDTDPIIPLTCGCIMKNGKTCIVRPTYKTDEGGVWACGLHIKQHLPVSECSICLENCPSSECVVTECKHVFHKKCFRIWLGTGNETCPLCRTVIPKKISTKSNNSEWYHVLLLMNANLDPDQVDQVMYMDAHYTLTHLPTTREQYHNGEWLPEEFFYT